MMLVRNAQHHKGKRASEDKFVSIWMGELGRQAKFANIAFDGIRQNYPFNGKNIDSFWYSTQSYFAAVGNISKILWPPDKNRKERGRRALGCRA